MGSVRASRWFWARGPGHSFTESDTFPVPQILIRNRATDLDARMHDGTTPLILAARLAVEGMLDDLISSHADVNAVDDLGMRQRPGRGDGPAPARPAPTFHALPAQASRPCTGPRPSTTWRPPWCC